MILHGDCLEQLKLMPDASADSLVTDPPAGISFMGKAWDDDKGGRDEWIKWLSEVMRECRRVLKPGAHALVWAIPRTSHWTATAIEDAGFEIRDVVTHLFGSGFPKSLDVSKAIDKAALTVGHKEYSAPDIRGNSYDQAHVSERERLGVPITAPSTDAAKQWQGFGTALKPAAEFWILARNPLAEKTVAANVCKHGTGALNIDGCRVSGLPSGLKPYIRKAYIRKKLNSAWNGDENGKKGMLRVGQPVMFTDHPQGRFPANLVLSHSPECVEVGVKQFKRTGGGPHSTNERIGIQGSGAVWQMPGNGLNRTTHQAADGTETVPDFKCAPGCAVAELDKQSGQSKSSVRKPTGGVRGHHHGQERKLLDRTTLGLSDAGGASRFFLCATYDKSELCGLESTKGGGTSAGKRTENKSEGLSTDGFGSKFTDQYLMGTISITEMGTHSIITFPILSASTKTCIGTITIESGKTIERSLAESVVGVSVASATEACLYFQSGRREPITGIVNLASESISLAGVIKTVSTGTRTIGHIAPNSSRFFYCAKVSPSERNAGMGDKTNGHPTVKATRLMRYLIRLVTPPGGIVLDPFTGSGSTGVAAIQEGFAFLGIERENEYVEIARARLKHVTDAVATKVV